MTLTDPELTVFKTKHLKLQCTALRNQARGSTRLEINPLCSTQAFRCLTYEIPVNKKLQNIWSSRNNKPSLIG